MDLPSARLPGGALIGMIHLPALPGSVRAHRSLDEIIGQVRSDADLLIQRGFDAILIENYGDVPFVGGAVAPHTVAAMAIIVHELRRSFSGPLGVNVLRNDARAAVALAAVAGADFLRVNVLCGTYATDQGLIEGRAAEIFQYRAALGGRGAILADVHVKHAEPLSSPDLAQAAEETAYRAGADALIVSGPATGRPTAMEDVRVVKHVVPDRPVYVGSGVTADDVRDVLAVADGVIVGTALKHDGRTESPLDAQRVEAFVRAAGA